MATEKTREQKAEEAALAASIIRRYIKFSDGKKNLFPGIDFSCPAWDILMDLTAARIERKSVSVSSVCIAASVPSTTALRWVNHLCRAGILVREKDQSDGRRSQVAISPDAFQTVVNYLVTAYV